MIVTKEYGFALLVDTMTRIRVAGIASPTAITRDTSVLADEAHLMLRAAEKIIEENPAPKRRWFK